MVIVLLGGLPTTPWLCRYRLRNPSFLGNRLLQHGVKPAAIVATPLPIRPILTEWWQRHGYQLPLVMLQRYVGRRRSASIAKAHEQTPMTCVEVATPVFRVLSAKDPRCVAILNELSPDVVVYLGGREIIPRRVLEIPRLGVLGAHWGPLPAYRSMNVTEWTIFNGDQPAVAVQFMSAGVDIGDIVLQRPLPIYPGDTISALRERSSELGTQLLVEAILLLEAGRATRIPQRLEDGRQYFVMDPRLKRLVEQRLAEMVAV